MSIGLKSWCEDMLVIAVIQNAPCVRCPDEMISLDMDSVRGIALASAP